jgi:GxxExxY protein
MLCKDEILGIANQVFDGLGSDYTESIYREAFLVELRLKGCEYDRERVIPVTYKKQHVGSCKADVVVRRGSEEIILELKADKQDVKESAKGQLQSYLRAMSGVQDGITRKGFIVLFPPTSDGKKKNEETDTEKVTVEEVVFDECPAKSAAQV